MRPRGNKLRFPRESSASGGEESRVLNKLSLRFQRAENASAAPPVGCFSGEQEPRLNNIYAARQPEEKTRSARMKMRRTGGHNYRKEEKTFANTLSIRRLHFHDRTSIVSIAINPFVTSAGYIQGVPASVARSENDSTRKKEVKSEE